MRVFALKLSLAFGLRLFALPAFGGSVRGQVVDQNGRPVAGATVTLTQKRWDYWSFARVRAIKSDQEGRFEFLGTTSLPCAIFVRLDEASGTRYFASSTRNPDQEWREPLSASLSETVTLTSEPSSPLDMTTPTQGQTFNLDEMRSIPMR